MSLFPRLGSCAACAIGLFMASAPAATYYSKPELVNPSVGLLETEFRNGYYRGSATVARDSRILYSCAHLVYESGIWAEDYTFHRAWHSRTYPAKNLGVSPRGFHYFSAYTRAARYTNGETDASFANDFTVFYGSRSFGPAVRVKEYSGRALRATRPKRIVGYPSIIDFTGDRGYSYQHSTGWFPNRAHRIRDEYYDFYGVSTGSGNSGGGIFLYNASTGQDMLAGILVSGGYRSAGVVAMDESTRSLARSAIGSAQSQWTIANTNVVSSPQSGGILRRALPVYDAEGAVESLALDLRMSGVEGDEPVVFLQSPTGRIRRIATSDAVLGGIDIQAQDTGDAFRGTVTQGIWSVRIHTKSPATFGRACLHGISAD